MKTQELIDFVATLMNRADIPGAHLLSMLNAVQEEVSRELQIPRGIVDYNNLTDPTQFTLPADGREEGVIEVYAITRNTLGEQTGSRRLPMYDFRTASQYHPGWTHWEPDGEAQFMVYDPAQDPNQPLLIPEPSIAHPQHLRMVYAVKPEPMVGMEDEPFNGKHESFHTILAYRVSYLMTGSEIHLREYERQMNAARGAAPTGRVRAFNPMFPGAVYGRR